MKRHLVTLATLLVFCTSMPCPAQHRQVARRGTARALPAHFLGCWSDASGDTLSVAAGRIKYGRGRWVRYAVLPVRPDDNLHLLRLFSPGEFNFLSNIISLSLEGEEMRMILYESLEHYSQGKKLGWATWHNDRCGARRALSR